MHFPKDVFSVLLLTVVGALAHGTLAFCRVDAGFLRLVDFCRPRNHLEERLLDQAQARASYAPLFWGHSRSIPQGMILDVQTLVKSLSCPIRPSPNGCLDSEASIP